jgi:uncharacterized protein YtpQ (UPF0354 family)
VGLAMSKEEFLYNESEDIFRRKKEGEKILTIALHPVKIENENRKFLAIESVHTS